MQPTIETFAADIVAKCFAKSTWGATYVPIETAKRAWATSDHPNFHAALRLLDDLGFLVWHKGRTCYGLASDRLGDAYAFAVNYASPKRQVALLARGGPYGPAQPDDEEDNQPLPEPTPRAPDLEDLVTRAELEHAIRMLRADLATARRTEVSHDRDQHSELVALRVEVAELRNDVGRLVAQMDAQADINRDLTERLAAMEEGATLLGQAIDAANAVHQQRVTELQRIRATLDHACFCGRGAVRVVPRFVAVGGKWQRRTDVGLCETHNSDVVGWVAQVMRDARARAGQLVRRLPAKNLPFLVGDRDACLAVHEALQRAGRMPKGVATTDLTRQMEAAEAVGHLQFDDEAE